MDRCCRHAAALADGIGALPGAELVAPATLNQALVRFHSSRGDAEEVDHDARTTEVIAAINRKGTAFFTGGSWRGRRVMRISV